MSEPVDRTLWSEERVETLLRDFFRNEMPSELQEQIDPPLAAQAAPRRVHAPSRRGRLAGVAIAATAVALMLAALMNPTGRIGLRDAEGPAVTGNPDDAHPALERFVGPDGPVELRARKGIENVDTGIEIEYPEWEADIRVFRIEEDRNGKPKAGSRETERSGSER